MKSTHIPLTLTIPEEHDFPLISFMSNGEMVIKGRLSSSVPFETGNIAIEWLKRYANNPAKVTSMTIDLEELNEKSALFLLEIMQIMKTVKLKQFVVNIIWKVADDNEEMIETIRKIEKISGGLGIVILSIIQVA